MVVLSIGLLGLSGLQTTGLRNNHSAFLRSQATVVTNDILDRMRANRDSAAALAYNINYGATPASPSCSGTGCSATDVARLNVAEWLAHVARLPGGQGQISVVQVPITVSGVTFNVDVAEVKVRWDDTRNGTLLEIVTRAQI
jgi:type IV pilus assembly protein PilV